MQLARLAMVMVPVLLVGTACSGGSPTADWETGKDVLDGLKSAGFTCDWTGSGEQVQTTNPLTGKDDGYPVVGCDDYGIVLFESQDALVESVRQQPDACEGLTQADLEDEQAQTPLVLGDNFLVIPSGEFPGDAQPQDFVKAFGGEATTLLGLYRLICPDAEIPAPDGSGAAGGSGSNGALESELRSAALALETFYTTNDSYPASLSDADYESTTTGVTVVATTTSTGYCLTAEDEGGAVRYYDSTAGGFTDSPC